MRQSLVAALLPLLQHSMAEYQTSELSPAQAWLHRWVIAREGTPQYHGPPAAEFSTIMRGGGGKKGRIPKIILMTVRAVDEAVINHNDSMSTWWTLNPEYAYLMLTSGGDGKEFLKACCSDQEQLAYGLVKHGPMQADLFRAIFIREIGGIYIDQDSWLSKPLRSFVPPWASIVTAAPAINSSTFRTQWTFNFFASERGSPILYYSVRHAASLIIRQARFACLKDHMGCRGFMNCVQNVTGTRTYNRAIEAVTRQYGCRSMADCQSATHPMLRRLHVMTHTELPMKHVACHGKRSGKYNLKGVCHRRNESAAHYVAIPAASYSYYKANPRGRREKSSAPGYFNPYCEGAVPSPKDAKNPGKWRPEWWK